MANGFSKSEMIFFEDVLMGFNPNNVVSKNVKKYRPNMTTFERSGQTFQRPIPMIARTTTGLSVASDYKDLQELTVPAGLASTDIVNHAFTMAGAELNDTLRRERAAKAAYQALSSQLDVLTTNKIALSGSLGVTRTGDFTSYDDLSTGEVQLFEREVPASYMKTLALNPRMAKKMANELASRSTDNKRDMNAYEKSILPPVGGFETVRTNVQTAITGAASPTVTLNGANQRKTPTVFDGTNHSAADNRYQTITVTNTSGSMANGDLFTIEGVYAIGMISKKTTDQLQTFRVISGGGTTSLVISPAIIPVDYTAGGAPFTNYGNCSTTPSSGAALTRLNTATKQPSIFYCEEAVEIIHGSFDLDEAATAGAAITRGQTESGIEILFVKQFAIDGLSTKYRLTFWAAPNVLEPQMCGIYLPGQAAAFG